MIRKDGTRKRIGIQRWRRKGEKDAFTRFITLKMY